MLKTPLWVQHAGYKRLFAPNQMTLGLFAPLESHRGIPSLNPHYDLIEQAEQLGFGAIWMRDVPLYDSNFGDAGQVFDPWSYLGAIAARTQRITIGTAAIVLPLRHPLHTAKAAASIDRLSEGRLILGVATGDRPVEFPIFGTNYNNRGQVFRSAVKSMRQAWSKDYNLYGIDTLPKPLQQNIPIIVVGHSQQSLEWIGSHADGWMYYPKGIQQTKLILNQWQVVSSGFKPYLQGMVLDLAFNPKASPQPIHLGYTVGRNWLLDYLYEMKASGVNHFTFGFLNAQRPVDEVIQELAEEILPHFPSIN